LLSGPGAQYGAVGFAQVEELQAGLLPIWVGPDGVDMQAYRGTVAAESESDAMDRMQVERLRGRDQDAVFAEVEDGRGVVIRVLFLVLPGESERQGIARGDAGVEAAFGGKLVARG
jgi:hypothetical protein